MSKSFNVSFTQRFKVTISEDTVQAIRATLSATLAIGEARPESTTDSQKALGAAMREWLKGDDNEFLSHFLKYAMRTQLRDSVIEELTGEKSLGCSKFAPALVEVTPRGN